MILACFLLSWFAYGCGVFIYGGGLCLTGFCLSGLRGLAFFWWGCIAGVFAGFAEDCVLAGVGRLARDLTVDAGYLVVVGYLFSVLLGWLFVFLFCFFC